MEDPSVIIVAESGSDVSPELAEEYGIYIVPMYVIFGDDQRNDGSFPTQDIVDYYEKTGKVPKTSGTSIGDFQEMFDRIHEEHPNSGILYLAYSAVTTCSFASASVAAKDRPYVKLVDTKVVSAGQCAVVIKMAEELKKHPEWDLEQAAKAAEEISKRTKFFFLPTNLSFLQAGGRLSNAAAVFGKLLRIIPVVELKDGLLVAVKKFRGRIDSIMPKAISDYEARFHFDKAVCWFVSTPGFTDESRRIIEDYVKTIGFKMVRWLDSGGVITTHGGPNAIGMAAMVPEGR